MIAQSFEYAAPETLSEALNLLANENAKPLAGGMSLIPLMKLRLAAPEQLIDIGRLKELNYVEVHGDHLHIGAGTTHWQVLESALIRQHCPLLSETVANIGDIQVRNQGTIGGSAAHADPAADYPASFCALEAKFKLVKKDGERIVSAGDFFVDMLTTVLEPGEIITQVIVPIEASGVGVSYQKCVHPASGYAIVGIAARVSGSLVRIGVTGVGAKAYRAHHAEEVYSATRDVTQAAAVVAEGVDANSDLHASATYRKHLAQIYAQRALKQAASRMA